MGKSIMVFITFVFLVSLGMIDSAFAESPGPGPKLKDDKNGLQEAMALISGIAHIEFQHKKNEKERWDYYAVCRKENCLIKISNEINIIDTVSEKTKGTMYAEATINFKDIDKISLAPVENTVTDNQDYLRATVSCRAYTKCIKSEKISENVTHENNMLDNYFFIVRKTKSNAELEKVFNLAIKYCSSN
jgi:hypothetical protein